MFKIKKVKEICGYPIDLWIVDTNSKKKVKRKLGGLKIPKHTLALTTLDYVNNTLRLILLFNSKDKHRKLNSSIIAHECYHAQSLLFEYISESGACEEPRAYLLENIHRECIKFLKVKEI